MYFLHIKGYYHFSDFILKITYIMICKITY